MTAPPRNARRALAFPRNARRALSPAAAALVPAAAALALAAAVAACGSTSPSSAPAATGSAGKHTPSHPATSAPPSSPSPTVTPTSSATAAIAGCLSRYLRANAGVSQGTAGSDYVVIVFTNLDNQPCTLYGYPGVSFGAGTPVRQVGLAAAENPVSPRRLVTLQPGGTANALLRITDTGDYSPTSCGPVKTSWLQVIPPNQSISLYVSFHDMTCSRPIRILAVSVVEPGSGSGSG